jgi:hypothetical protein
MEPMKLPAGYRLPKGTTMADVRRLDLELLASEGLKVDDLKTENDRRDDGRKSKQYRVSFGHISFVGRERWSTFNSPPTSSHSSSRCARPFSTLPSKTD